MGSLPRVALVVTGGTLTLVGRDRLDLAEYFLTGRRLGAAELLASVPEVAAVASVEERPFRRVDSHAMVDRDWLDLLSAVEAAVDDGAVGVVVAHGTNTIEETAFFLNLALKRDRPVVLVGSMRPPSAVSADGPLNLLNAVRVAADPSSAGRGVLVVMNDTIHAARDATKVATYRVDAIAAPGAGPVGSVDPDGRPRYSHRVERPHTIDTEFDVSGRTDLPAVGIVVSHVGADGRLIDALVTGGAQGIVSAGTGAGRPTPAEDEALDRARASGVVVCQASRVWLGPVIASANLARRGFVAAGDLRPWQARTLLSLALTRTGEASEIQRMFDTY